MKLKVLKLHPNATLPTKTNSDDLGYDLYSLESFVVASSSGTIKVRTGIAVSFPEGWGGIVKDRSSMAGNDLVVSGGVIDGGYIGEIIVLMRTIVPNQCYYLAKGQKIAQLVPIQVTNFEIEEVDRLLETVRGDKGFGSSGA